MIESNIPITRKILLVVGENGNTTLRDQLRTIGYSVWEWPVYRRVANDSVDFSELERDDVIEISSVFALKAVRNSLITLNRIPLVKVRLLVPSQRIRTKALELGFTSVTVCDGATPIEIEAGLADLVR